MEILRQLERMAKTRGFWVVGAVTPAAGLVEIRQLGKSEEKGRR